MKRFQTIFIFLSLMAVLLAAIFLPKAISELKDQMLIGKVTIQKLNEEKTHMGADLSVEDKLKLIHDYSIGTGTVAVVSQEQNLYSKKSDEETNAIILQEINELKRYDAFPDLTIDAVQYIDKTVRTYTDMERPGSTVEIWIITFSIDQNVVNLWMDGDDHLIYQYSVYSKTPLQNFPPKDISEKFQDYLGIQWGKIALSDHSGADQYFIRKDRMMYQFNGNDDGSIYSISLR